MRPPDYMPMQQPTLPLPAPPPPPPPPRPLDYLLTQRPWQLPPWIHLLGPGLLPRPPPPPAVQPPARPEIQLKLPDFGDFAADRRRFGTRVDTAPPPFAAPQDLEAWLRMRRIQDLPPGLREAYSFLMGAGNFAMLTPGIDVLARWIRREDPTKGLEEFRKESQGAFYASPLAHFFGQGFGLAGLGGLAARGLMAKGAELGARGAVGQLLAGLGAAAKPAAVGGAAGAAAGAAVGAATGRDPATEAFKLGVLGATAGLGATRHQLAAGGILGAVVGGSTAARYGVEKGIEAGAAVFPLPIVLPERLARGVFAGFAAERRRLRTELLTEPRVETQPSQPRVELPTMQDVRMYMLLTRRAFSDVVADMARQTPPEQRRDLFESVAEMSLGRLRARYDRDAVFAVLRSVRSKLDPTLRAQFDEVLSQYGLSEAKHRSPEYSLREEDAAKLAKLFRRDPEYALTDRSAELLDQLFKMEQKQEPQYALTDAAAKKLNLFLRRTPEYALRDEDAAVLARIFKRDTQRAPEYQLTDEAAELLDQFLRMDEKTALIFRHVPADVHIFRRRIRPADASRLGQETWLVPSEGAPTVQIFSRRVRDALEPGQETQPAQISRLRQTDRLELAPMYRLEPAARQGQTYVGIPIVAQRVATTPRVVAVATTAPRATQRTATTPVTTGRTTPVQTATTTPPPEQPPPRAPPPETPPGRPPSEPPPRTPPDQPPGAPPPRTPPERPPHIPPWMLKLPVSAALPLLAQMGVRLPPPPNPNMPLGVYLRMLRFPGLLGRQREVFVLI